MKLRKPSNNKVNTTGILYEVKIKTNASGLLYELYEVINDPEELERLLQPIETIILKIKEPIKELIKDPIIYEFLEIPQKPKKYKRTLKRSIK